jgi:16S rRNA (uracil1498-N3)-methyltransferase
VVLFDGLKQDRLYKVEKLKEDEAHLVYITDLDRNLPARDVYLLWALLKEDKNDWIIQKASELGVNHFIPLRADRCDKTKLSQNRQDRWESIAVKAAEQAGRSNIPNIRGPLNVDTAINELKSKITLLVCERSGEIENEKWEMISTPIGILIGPENGWSDRERQLFGENKLLHLNSWNPTLQPETASITVVTKLLQ